MLKTYSCSTPTPSPSLLSSPSTSFPPLGTAARFEHPKRAPSVKRIDFALRPHLLKYLAVHLKLGRKADAAGALDDYVLSKSNRFGFALNALLRKPVKSARHEGSIDDCTALLGVDLRNFNGSYYDLLQGKLSPYVVFQFNDFVEEIFREELYWWVTQHRARRATIKDAIRSFMELYEVSEDDIAYETLRKDVQRNGNIPPLKKKAAKKGDFPMNVSQKMGGLSQKMGLVSQKIGVMSHKATFAAVRQELTKLPLPLFEADFFHAAR